MVRAHAELCIVVHRSLAASRGVKDGARQVDRGEVPTYRINSDEGRPK